MACLWVQEPPFLVLLPGGKKSSELHGNRGAVEGYLAITQRKDCVAESS